jgi:hypothetical protein
LRSLLELRGSFSVLTANSCLPVSLADSTTSLPWLRISSDALLLLVTFHCPTTTNFLYLQWSRGHDSVTQIAAITHHYLIDTIYHHILCRPQCRFEQSLMHSIDRHSHSTRNTPHMGKEVHVDRQEYIQPTLFGWSREEAEPNKEALTLPCSAAKPSVGWVRMRIVKLQQSSLSG